MTSLGPTGPFACKVADRGFIPIRSERVAARDAANTIPKNQTQADLRVAIDRTVRTVAKDAWAEKRPPIHKSGVKVPGFQPVATKGGGR